MGAVEGPARDQSVTENGPAVLGLQMLRTLKGRTADK